MDDENEYSDSLLNGMYHIGNGIWVGPNHTEENFRHWEKTGRDDPKDVIFVYSPDNDFNFSLSMEEFTRLYNAVVNTVEYYRSHGYEI